MEMIWTRSLNKIMSSPRLMDAHDAVVTWAVVAEIVSDMMRILKC